MCGEEQHSQEFAEWGYLLRAPGKTLHRPATLTKPWRGPGPGLEVHVTVTYNPIVLRSLGARQVSGVEQFLERGIAVALPCSDTQAGLAALKSECDRLGV